MVIPVTEVVRMAQEGALEVRGDLERPALVTWVAVRR
jgi:hypothetical protein